MVEEEEKHTTNIYISLLFLMSAVKCILDKWILYFFDISFHQKKKSCTPSKQNNRFNTQSDMK